MNDQAMEHAAPTLEDVARLAGVSRATASRVIRGDVPVSPATAEAVTGAVRELGYSPNLAARTLVTRRSGMVAVLVPETDLRVFSDPFFAALYHGVLTSFAGEEAQVVLAMAKPGEPAERMTRYLVSGRIEGAVVASHHGTGIAQAMADLNYPVVFVGDPGIPGLPFVDLDQRAAAMTATRHLVERGCRRIAAVNGPADMVAGRGRRDGFLQAMADAGLEPAGMEEGEFTAESGRAAMARLLSGGVRFDGVFVASDLMAVAGLRALSDAGVRVPDDVALVGFDDTELGRSATPALTTMTNPAHAMALTAGSMLRELLAGRRPESPVILTSDLVVRDSA